MHLRFQNVNYAFNGIVTGFCRGLGIEVANPYGWPRFPVVTQDSRNGPVYVIPEPVTITYENPLQRVLLNKERDANPFFHLYESLWMLAGRNDVAPLSFYNSKISGIASDDNETFNGAYGYRWRNAEWITLEERECGLTEDGETDFEEETVVKVVDQLDCIIKHLSTYPDSRRAVLQMWNVKDDLLKIDTESRLWYSKDVCCNLSVCFLIREIPETVNEEGDPTKYGKYVLDMTVFNRSNDTIWGALGANVVHFSFLQEYIACALGLEVGAYHQITNNLHVYQSNWYPEKWLSCPCPVIAKEHVPLFSGNPREFDREVCSFVTAFSRQIHPIGIMPKYDNKFLETVAKPMCLAFHAYKEGEYMNAMTYVLNVADLPWRIAARQWLTKRFVNQWKKLGYELGYGEGENVSLPTREGV